MSEDPAGYESAVGGLLSRPLLPTVGLEASTTLSELLGRPDRAYPSIRVVGASGSVARMIVALLGALGLKAGCLLSEHLQDVRERISVAGESISREDLLGRLRELEPFLAEVDARHPAPMSRTEVLASTAFAHFADTPVDVAVFEAANTGTPEPTDLVRGEVAVLAADAWARPAEAPASEERPRADLITEDATVVSLTAEPGPGEALEQACRERGASLVAVSTDEAVAARRLAVGGQHLDLRGRTGEFDDIYLPLHGRHQAANAALALTAVEGFLGFAGGLDPEVIREGFAAVRVPGQLEVVRRTDASTVVLDVARSPAAAEGLAAALRDEFSFRHRVLVLAAAGADEAREAEDVLGPLLAVTEHIVTATAGSEGAPAEALAAAAGSRGVAVESADDVPAALELASGVARLEDGVVVTGPPSLVGAARRALGLGVA